jgi:hypothetical protein
VRAELEERVNSHYQRFAGQSLAANLGPDTTYFLGKMSAAVHGAQPGHSDLYDHPNRIGVETILERLRAIDDGLQARGYDDEQDRRVVLTALYICRRTLQLLDHEPRAPDPTDAAILVCHALPLLIEALRTTALEIDQEFESRRQGWDPQGS